MGKSRRTRSAESPILQPYFTRPQELFLLISVVSLGTLAIGFLAFGWTGPASNPPNGNTASPGVPSGTIAFFAGACPSGWTEYTALRGRALVGTPSGGTDAGTVGSALGNLANRTVNQVAAHTHAVDPPSTASGVNSADHTHSVDPASTALSITDPGHSHSVPLGDGGSGASLGAYPGQANNLGSQAASNNSTGISGSVNIGPTTSGGASANHTHATDISQFDSGSTGAASVDVTMPYVQLRACQKS